MCDQDSIHVIKPDESGSRGFDPHPLQHPACESARGVSQSYRAVAGSVGRGLDDASTAVQAGCGPQGLPVTQCDDLSGLRFPDHLAYPQRPTRNTTAILSRPAAAQ